MKTDDLISLLSADASVRQRLGRALALALVIGVLVSFILLIGTVGLRHNLVSVFETARVLFKIGFTLLLAAIATALVWRIGRPGVSARLRAWLLLLPLGVLMAGVAVELAVLPRDAWMAKWEGAHAAFCVFFIPVLSLAPLGGLMAALRDGAPANPGLAGAVAGLAAGTLGSALYAWHCPDDSPLFVATWYLLGILIVTGVGYLCGRRLLRW
ncbi:DUF1109 domain-containing protein [Ancylobacter sonchi]|uniref:NrsF family protein n=1 Tax=Ancylobacter sonchi TaxID=1937790 RepID=UPI001BD4F537|nr:DUF1109 domain-containing protein [Ancylobacter sonchi]MBS7532659.1 DUF1109 domain-containing protein [Ancylobacter sonchi]